MDCTVSWVGPGNTTSGLAFVAQTGSGHALLMDGAPNPAQPHLGGANLAPRPMELLLAGLGGCTAYDVVLILQRGRHAVRGCRVQLSSERASTDPKVFTRIHLHFVVAGKELNREAVARAIDLSQRTYCSASAMLEKTAALTTSFEVVDASDAPPAPNLPSDPAPTA